MLVALIFFLALFTQAVSGFGLALVSMPLLAALLGIQVATPLVAVVALAGEAWLVAHFRAAIDRRLVVRLVLASLLGIPLGILWLRQVDERLVTGLLGLIVVVYALYALLAPRLPSLTHAWWLFLSGFLGGLLGAAYNTSGPPVIVFGHCRQWPARQFKGNLQGFFVANSVVVFFAHLAAGNVTPEIWRHALWALPGVALGIILGVRLDPYLPPERFRQIVLGLLVVLGLRLIIG